MGGARGGWGEKEHCAQHARLERKQERSQKAELPHLGAALPRLGKRMTKPLVCSAPSCGWICIIAALLLSREDRRGARDPRPRLFSAKADRIRVRQLRVPPSSGQNQGLPLRAAQAALLMALEELAYAHPVLAVSKKRRNCVCPCVCSVITALSQQISEDLPAPARVLIGHRARAISPKGHASYVNAYGARIGDKKKQEGSIETPRVRRSTRGQRSCLKLKFMRMP